VDVHDNPGQEDLFCEAGTKKAPAKPGPAISRK
jgi:hypothetical protein